MAKNDMSPARLRSRARAVHTRNGRPAKHVAFQAALPANVVHRYAVNAMHTAALRAVQ